MVYAGLAGALLGIVSVIFAVYADHFADRERLLLVAAGFVLFLVSVWWL